MGDHIGQIDGIRQFVIDVTLDWLAVGLNPHDASFVTGEHPRLRSTDPGVVEHNPVFPYHEAFNTNTEEVEDLKDRYRTGRVSDSEVKERLVKALNEFLDPIRERRAYFESRPDAVREALLSGTERARKIAQGAMQEVREAMRVVCHDRSVIHNLV